MSSRSLNILHLMSVRQYVGEAARVQTLACEQARRGHRVGILLREGPCAEVMRAAEPFCAFLETAPAGEGFVGGVRRIRSLIEREGIDVLHAHRGKDHWRALAARMLSAAVQPLLVRTRHVVTPVKPHWPNRWLYGHATDAIICASNAIAAVMERSLPMLAGQLHVVPGGLGDEAPPSVAPEAVAALRQRLHIAENAPVLVMPARIAPVKGQEYLLEAMPRILQSVPDAVAVFAYPRSSGYRVALDTRVQALGLQNAVRWVTALESIWPLLSMGTLCVVASIGSEGWSRVAVEAMKCGVPVVATQVGSLPEIVKDGETGLLVPPADAGALADAVVRILSSSEEQANMRVAALEAARVYTASRMTDVVMRVYASVAEKDDEIRASDL